MNEDEFIQAVTLVRKFTALQLQQAKESLFILMSEMENEKKNISNEVRRSILYFEVSNRVKQKRIKYIDEIILPIKSSQMTSNANDVFPDLRVTSLQKIKSFRKEKERLSKTTGDYLLKVRQNAKLLSVTYSELNKLEKQYNQLNQAAVVRKFFENRSIPVDGIIESDIVRYYQSFRKDGL